VKWRIDPVVTLQAQAIIELLALALERNLTIGRIPFGLEPALPGTMVSVGSPGPELKAA